MNEQTVEALCDKIAQLEEENAKQREQIEKTNMILSAIIEVNLKLLEDK